MEFSQIFCAKIHTFPWEMLPLFYLTRPTPLWYTTSLLYDSKVVEFLPFLLGGSSMSFKRFGDEWNGCVTWARRAHNILLALLPPFSLSPSLSSRSLPYFVPWEGGCSPPAASYTAITLAHIVVCYFDLGKGWSFTPAAKLDHQQILWLFIVIVWKEIQNVRVYLRAIDLHHGSPSSFSTSKILHLTQNWKWS